MFSFFFYTNIKTDTIRGSILFYPAMQQWSSRRVFRVDKCATWRVRKKTERETQREGERGRERYKNGGTVNIGLPAASRSLPRKAVGRRSGGV